MNLSAVLSTASSGLDSVSRRLGIVSQNVANAGTPGYVREQLQVSASTADGEGNGVRNGVAVRMDDPAMQASTWTQAGVVAGLAARSTALSALDQASGQVAGGTDLASQLTAVRDAFSTLQADPSSQVQQQQVVSTAQTLAGGINGLADAYTAQRQAAQDGLVSDAATANAALKQIGQLSRQIVTLKGQGQSTADLESQRDVQLGTLAGLVDLQVMPQNSGGVVLATRNGLVLPTDAASGPFSIGTVTVGSGSAYPSTLPGLMLGGTDVTVQLGGGRLGAELSLRDKDIPTLQAGLDGFAQALADRFSAQGLTLFTAASGTPLAAGGAVGAASSIAVNPAVASMPSLVRDGTDPVAGSAAGASAFTPNPSGGPAGFDTLIKRVLGQTFGAEAQPGVAQPAAATTGLGAGGTLSLSYSAAPTLSGMASMVGGTQAQLVSEASGRLSTETAVQSALQSKLASGTGVTVDAEMSDMVQLQASYQANAKVLTAVQTMWDQLIAMVK